MDHNKSLHKGEVFSFVSTSFSNSAQKGSVPFSKTGWDLLTLLDEKVGTAEDNTIRLRRIWTIALFYLSKNAYPALTVGKEDWKISLE